jgi:cytoskeletal protein CcmA (bactofilin family)
MLWKFKRSEPSQASAAAVTPPPTSPNYVADKPQATAPSKVENEDVIAGHHPGTYLIPAGYRIIGSLVTHRHVVVEGDLQGPALVAPSVHVSTSGRLNIPTQAATITVSGTVEAPVMARDTVEVRAGGSLRSDVEAGGLSILPGGMVSGARLAIGPLRRRES